MHVGTAMLLISGIVTLLLLVLAVLAFRASWKAVYKSMLAYWFPHKATAQADEDYIAKQNVVFVEGLFLLAAAAFVGYWTLMLWGLSQA